MAGTWLGSLMRVGVTPELSRVDASRVALLNALALVTALGAAGGFLAPTTYEEPVFLLTASAMVLASLLVFVLHSRLRRSAAASVYLAAAFFVTILPPLFVSPWGGHVFNFLPLIALPWLLVTSQSFGIALTLSGLAAVAYIAVINAYGLAFDMRAIQALTGSYAYISPAIIALLVGLVSHFSRRITVSAELALERERAQPAELVHEMLPESVAAEVLAGEPRRAQRFGDASVLFCAIDSFEEILEQSDGAALIRLLDRVYARFDELCSEYGVEKVKTYGERYLAVSGVPSFREDHAEALAALALDMQRAVVGICTSEGTPVRLRIGINSGPLVAGVIGQTQLTYDIWGDTVNLAQRMELHGEPGDIQVSPLTYAKINHRFVCKSRPPIDVKGRGPMKAYVVRGGRDA